MILSHHKMLLNLTQWVFKVLIQKILFRVFFFIVVFFFWLGLFFLKLLFKAQTVLLSNNKSLLLKGWFAAGVLSFLMTVPSHKAFILTLFMTYDFHITKRRPQGYLCFTMSKTFLQSHPGLEFLTHLILTCLQMITYGLARLSCLKVLRHVITKWWFWTCFASVPLLTLVRTFKTWCHLNSVNLCAKVSHVTCFSRVFAVVSQE